MQNENLEIIMEPNRRLEYNRFHIVCDLLSMICLNLLLLFKISIYRFSYNFYTVLYQFLETVTETSDRYIYRSMPEILRFYSKPHFIFPIQSL